MQRTLRKRSTLKDKAVISKTKIRTDKSVSEADFQKNVVKFLRCYQDLFVIYTDAVSPSLKFIPNGAMRLGFISYSKSRGWEKGVTDLVLIWHGKVTFLELKYDGKTKGTLKPEQKDYKNRVENAGYEWQCWRTMDDAVLWVNKRLNEINKK